MPVITIDQKLYEHVWMIANHYSISLDEMATDLISSAIDDRDKHIKFLDKWYLLTPREQEVAACIYYGHTNQEIAIRLGISPETAKTHIRNVLNKFAMHKKTDFGRLLYEHLDSKLAKFLMNNIK